MNDIEILSPAGSVEAMKAAFRAGADAAYIGGTSFGARAFAQNPETKELLDAIDYAHIHGKKLYLTVNTLMKNDEIRCKLIDFLAPFYEEGLDAVLVQDIGAIKLIHEEFPDMPIHASTQLTVCGASYGRWLAAMGVKRLVLPRELDISEIRQMNRETGLETEVFIHGAMCYCYSGQCLMSSMIGGRSGNRGRCAQPCRLRYSYEAQNGKHTAYMLSMKDLCGLDAIPDLIDAGVSSLKIEGRMKSPEYAALTSYIYRKYADIYLSGGREAYHVRKSDRKLLLDIFNRGSFTNGYYHESCGPDMMSVSKTGNNGVYVGKAVLSGNDSYRVKLDVDVNAGDIFQLPDGSAFRNREDAAAGNSLQIRWKSRKKTDAFKVMRTRNEALMRFADERFVNGPDIKEKINARVRILKDMPAKMEVDCAGITAASEGPVVQKAERAPLGIDEIRHRLKKSGNTPFVIDKLDIKTEGDVFIPVSAINSLRRSAFDSLKENILLQYRRNYKADPYELLTTYEKPSSEQKKRSELLSGKPAFSAIVSNMEQLEECLKYSEISIIYTESVLFDDETLETAAHLIHSYGRKFYIAMPHIFRMRDEKEITRRLAAFKQVDVDGFLVRNMESFLLLKENGLNKPAVGDYNMYCMNDIASSVYSGELERITLSPELNRHELSGMSSLASAELISYGKIPLMYSAQCLEKTSGCCRHKKGLHILTDRLGNRFPVRNICDLCYNIIYNCVPLCLPENMLHGSLPEMPSVLRMQFTDENAEKTGKAIRVITGISDESMQQNTFTRGHYLRGVE